ncbi:hypothetical protein [Paraburkholderia atlantica]|uniref:Uncharacterized protein n=1 Tax=Paraburkholderia atlantica TaxID=2654982 RepID=D5WBM9_PARAM|nr:hypothetical protein [Paraburkholderia atlantica]ADG16407.1 hypothetical protein BC1002_2352 [Paraburkholderia atlantica]MBB5509045.1 hypothetical protein [Paraburkholderia atlantica]
MYSIIRYRGFEIHLELTRAADEAFDVTFQIKRGTEALGAQGGRIMTARCYGCRAGVPSADEPRL